MQNARPVVVLTLGDPAGIGAELIARLLAQHPVCPLANVVLIGDPWLWEQGQQIAQVRVPTTSVDSFDKEKFAELIVRECCSIIFKRQMEAIDGDWNVDEGMSMASLDLLDLLEKTE